MAEHGKLCFVKKMRKVTDHVFLKMPLPRVNPNMVSGLSLVTSVFFLLTLNSAILAFSFLLLTLLLDWFDGLIAKKHNLCSEEGYMVDITADRLSEGIIFSAFLFPWFHLFALNTVLTMLSFSRKKHVIIPLRHIFLVFFLLTVIF